MPKTKTTEKPVDRTPETQVDKKIIKSLDELEKIVEINAEDGIELIPGEVNEEDPEDEDAVLDAEEIDPFKDKWEE